MRAGPRYVLIPVFCALTGYTPKAVQKKIEKRQWRVGQVVRKAPDGHVTIDLDAYEKWVEGERVLA
jgi:hypothetical protein